MIDDFRSQTLDTGDTFLSNYRIAFPVDVQIKCLIMCDVSSWFWLSASHRLLDALGCRRNQKQRSSSRAHLSQRLHAILSRFRIQALWCRMHRNRNREHYTVKLVLVNSTPLWISRESQYVTEVYSKTPENRRRTRFFVHILWKCACCVCEHVFIVILRVLLDCLKCKICKYITASGGRWKD